MENFENIKISKHCRQRYAQRVQGIVDEKELNRYMMADKEEIVENIHDMLQQGQVIYVGKNFEIHDNTIVQIVLNDTWLIFIDDESETAITMWKIDLGLGEDLNNAYVRTFLTRLQAIDDSYGETEDDIAESTSDIDTEIEKCNEKIKEYQDMIQQFENRKAGLEETKKSLRVYLNDIDMRRRSLIGKLIGKNIR